MLCNPEWKATEVKLPSPQLTPAIKAAWVRALRSGKYEQSKKGFFKLDGAHCCLGVLCEVIGAEPVIDSRGNWFALDQHLATRAQTDLYIMNDAPADEGGKTFPEIADYIEQNL